MKINGLTEWKCQSCKSTFHTIEGVVPENKCPDCYKPGTLVAGEEDGRQPSVAQTTPDDEAKPQARSAVVGEHAPVTDGLVELRRHVADLLREARVASGRAILSRDVPPHLKSGIGRVVSVLVGLNGELETETAISPAVTDLAHSQKGRERSPDNTQD